MDTLLEASNAIGTENAAARTKADGRSTPTVGGSSRVDGIDHCVSLTVNGPEKRVLGAFLSVGQGSRAGAT